MLQHSASAALMVGGEGFGCVLSLPPTLASWLGLTWAAWARELGLPPIRGQTHSPTRYQAYVSAERAHRLPMWRLAQPPFAVSGDITRDAVAAMEHGKPTSASYATTVVSVAQESCRRCCALGINASALLCFSEKLVTHA